MSGTAAAALPLIAPLGILITAIAAVAIGIDRSSPLRPMRIALGIFILGLALTGYLDSSLATALLSAAVLLSRPDTASIGIAVLLAQTSVAASLTALMSQKLPLGLEAAAPALIATTCLWLSRPFAVVLAIMASASSLVMAGIAPLTGVVPPMPMLTAGLSPVALAFMLVIRGTQRPMIGTYATLVSAIAAFSTWAWTVPRTTEGLTVLLPRQTEAHAAQFFQHYIEALSFAGVKTNLADSPEDIPTNSTVLLPWLTDPLALGDVGDKELGTLARERSWTVFLIGEHTNLGEVAARIERVTGQKLLSDDLTVPPGNKDESGHLHVSGLRAWPGEAILNRGASVAISSAVDRILLAGDGWWREKNIGEWLWVGDYMWRPGDRAGRVTLAAAFEDGRARWIVVGDNSPFINRQLVADPRPVLHLLDEASLWPAFTRDAIILAMAVCGFLSGIGPVLALAGASALLTIACWRGPLPSERWESLFRGESGFAERNFNETLVRHPILLNAHGWTLVRSSPISGDLTLPADDRVVFALVAGTVVIGETRISNCRRIGGIKTNEGPVLLDAQACVVDGPAEVILGGMTSAAAIRAKHRGSDLIMVFDSAFLARSAPPENAAWLTRVMKLN